MVWGLILRTLGRNSPKKSRTARAMHLVTWISSRASFPLCGRTHQSSVMVGKSGTGQGSKRFDKVPVVVGGFDIDVAHIGRQVRCYLLVDAGGLNPRTSRRYSEYSAS